MSPRPWRRMRALVGCCDDGAAAVSYMHLLCCCRRRFCIASNVGSDVPGVTLRFTEDGKSAFMGSRPGMAGAGRGLSQACR